MTLQVPLAGVALFEIPPDSMTSGAIIVLIGAIERAWPFCVAIGFGIWYLGRYAKSIESIAAAIKENKENVDKRLDSHSNTLDRHETRISKTEASTTILLNHTGLTAP